MQQECPALVYGLQTARTISRLQPKVQPCLQLYLAGVVRETVAGGRNLI